MVEDDTWRLGCVTGAVMIPPQTISKDLFLQQCKARRGAANPEETDRAFWKEMIRTGENGYLASSKYETEFGIPGKSPIWCFARFGMTTTRLPDGRWVQIAGEHEDHYDDDFFIYNDVIVYDGQGGVRIFTYPEDVFPPTDFHTATLLDDHILLIGSLGYQRQRYPDQTQVLRLNLKDFSIERVETTGDNPGWISRHTAELDGTHIIVSGGKKDNEAGQYVESTGRYALRLSDMVWSALD